MDETGINALLQTLAAQRNMAFDQVAQLVGEKATLEKELEALKTKLNGGNGHDPSAEAPGAQG